MFLKNIDPALEKILIGLLILGIYWFVFRRYNSLGFRMLVLFGLLCTAFAWWIRQDELLLKSLHTYGERYRATIIAKSKNKNTNNLRVAFRTKQGDTTQTTTNEYLSDAEWDSVQVGQAVEVIFAPLTQQVYVAQSLRRFQGDLWILYAVLGVFGLIGVGLAYLLWNYKVGLHHDSSDEYLTKDGKVVIDEKPSPLANNIKRLHIIMKLWQLFGKH